MSPSLENEIKTAVWMAVAGLKNELSAKAVSPDSLAMHNAVASMLAAFSDDLAKIIYANVEGQFHQEAKQYARQMAIEAFDRFINGKP